MCKRTKLPRGSAWPLKFPSTFCFSKQLHHLLHLQRKQPQCERMSVASSWLESVNDCDGGPVTVSGSVHVSGSRQHSERNVKVKYEKIVIMGMMAGKIPIPIPIRINFCLLSWSCSQIKIAMKHILYIDTFVVNCLKVPAIYRLYLLRIVELS